MIRKGMAINHIFGKNLIVMIIPIPAVFTVGWKYQWKHGKQIINLFTPQPYKLKAEN